MDKRTIGVNARGYRVGEDHQRARLTDAEVELIRQLRDGDGWTYAALAEKFEVSKSSIFDICQCRRRADLPTRWKVVRVSDADKEKLPS